MKSGELWERFKKLNPGQQRELIGYYLGGVGMDVDGWKDSQQRENYPHAKYLETEFEKALAYAEKIVPHINIIDSEQLEATIEDLPEMKKFETLDARTRQLVENGLECARQGKFSKNPPIIDPQWADEADEADEEDSKIIEDQVQFGKVSSSKCPPFHLIPLVALEKIAERFQCGIDRKGDGAWNAISHNQECLTDYKLIMDRISHVIHHAMKLRDKFHSENMELINSDDDASAVAWGGVFLICAIEALKTKKSNETKQASS